MRSRVNRVVAGSLSRVIGVRYILVESPREDLPIMHLLPELESGGCSALAKARFGKDLVATRDATLMGGSLFSFKYTVNIAPNRGPFKHRSPTYCGAVFDQVARVFKMPPMSSCAVMRLYAKQLKFLKVVLDQGKEDFVVVNAVNEDDARLTRAELKAVVGQNILFDVVLERHDKGLGSQVRNCLPIRGFGYYHSYYSYMIDPYVVTVSYLSLTLMSFYLDPSDICSLTNGKLGRDFEPTRDETWGSRLGARFSYKDCRIEVHGDERERGRLELYYPTLFGEIEWVGEPCPVGIGCRAKHMYDGQLGVLSSVLEIEGGEDATTVVGFPADSQSKLTALRQDIRPGRVCGVWVAMQRLDERASDGSLEKASYQ
ncbi:hypothetical protein FB451DRAFT_1180555 [Mycena latifolia]|nr:hypothetical protein FB451DRAFT_1180555 [Mycena latifolia]